MIIIDLLHNAALLLALIMGYEYIGATYKFTSLPSRLLNGLLFGAVAIIGMLTPLHFAPGLIYDGRSIVLSVAGFIGGPLIAAISAVMAAAFRIYLGGVGTLPGLLVIAESALLGTVWYHLRHRNRWWEHLLSIWLLGLSVHILMMLSQLIIPQTLRWDVLKTVGPPVVVFYPVVFVLIIKMFLERRDRRSTIGALQESEARYRNLFENRYAPMMIIDPENGRILDVNTAAVQFYGWSKNEFCQKNIDEINPLSKAEIKQAMDKARTQQKNYFEFRHKLKNGTLRDIAIFSGKVLLQGEERLFSIIHDLTPQKEMEKDLYMVSYSMEHAAIGILRIDEEGGHILYANRHIAIQLGYTQNELIGLTIFDIDSNLSSDKWKAHRAQARTNNSLTLESHLTHKDGSQVPSEITVSYFNYKNESYSFSFIKDISARTQAQKELKDSLEQKEILLQEVHHRVKNNLAVVNALINLQLNSKHSKTDTEKILHKTRDRILVMATVHNLLYKDQHLSRIDFTSFLKEIISQLNELYSIEDKVKVTIESEPLYLDITNAVPLGILLYELIDNAVTHAFPKSHSNSKLSISINTDHRSYTVKIQDNGVGLPPHFDLQQQKSLGFQLIRSLAQQISADIAIDSTNGTSIELSFQQQPHP